MLSKSGTSVEVYSQQLQTSGDRGVSWSHHVTLCGSSLRIQFYVQWFGMVLKGASGSLLSPRFCSCLAAESCRTWPYCLLTMSFWSPWIICSAWPLVRGSGDHSVLNRPFTPPLVIDRPLTSPTIPHDRLLARCNTERPASHDEEISVNEWFIGWMSISSDGKEVR